jgi:cation diffusion facilitator family transporter
METLSARQRGESAHRQGVAVNGSLAVLKIVGGFVSGSPSLLADGFHSLGDLLTNGGAWLSFRIAGRPADEDHHYGHGKAEALAGSFLGLLLVAGGLAVIVRALGTARPEYTGWEGPIALAVAVISIAANEWLVFVTRRSARELSSTAFHALARDNRSDSLTSVLVILGVLASLASLGWVEAAMTMVIGLVIAGMGAASVREGIDVLMDRAPDTNMRERIEEIGGRVPGVLGIQRVRVHPLGGRLRVDMEISVDGDLSVRRGHEIAHKVEAAVTRSEAAVVQVAVHVNPAEEIAGEGGPEGSESGL